jgi:hypothetical protein
MKFLYFCTGIQTCETSLIIKKIEFELRNEKRKEKRRKRIYMNKYTPSC